MKRILSLLVSAALVLGLVGMAPPARAVGDKLIAITYDDGPSTHTGALLDGLRARGVKATFFMVGTNVSRFPSTVARVYQEGHQVANHSYNHPQLTTLSTAGVREQVQSVNTLLDKTCGAGTRYMVRPPYGSVNTAVAQTVGAPLILWSVDPLDWKYRNAETVKNNIVRQAHDGAIILVHDLYGSSVTGSLAAIDILQAQGYEFVTVEELFRRRGVTAQDGVRYSQVSPNGTDLGPIAAPVITAQPEGAQLRVTITAQDGVPIYYALGDEPLNGSLYTEPFLVSVPCDIRAVAAFRMNGSRSETTAASFTTPVTAPPELRVTDGELSLGCATEEAAVYYALRGEDFQLYTAPVPLEADTVIAAYAQREGYLASEYVEASYSPNGNLFRDVFPGQWHYAAMDWAVSAGLLSGVGRNFYAPAAPLQRGQLLVLLYRFSGETAAASAAPFTDLPAYCAGAAAWAYEKGIVDGVDQQTFAPLRPVTRQEMCKIIAGYLQTLEVPLPDGTASRYKDQEEIAPWADEAVGQLTAMGLLTGSTFRPAAEASRAEAAAILMRLADYLRTAGGAEETGSAQEDSLSGSGAEETGGTTAQTEGAISTDPPAPGL